MNDKAPQGPTNNHQPHLYSHPPKSLRYSYGFPHGHPVKSVVVYHPYKFVNSHKFRDHVLDIDDVSE